MIMSKKALMLSLSMAVATCLPFTAQADTAEIMEEFQVQRMALMESYRNGEIDKDEFRAQLKELSAEMKARMQEYIASQSNPELPTPPTPPTPPENTGPSFDPAELRAVMDEYKEQMLAVRDDLSNGDITTEEFVTMINELRDALIQNIERITQGD